MHIQGKIGSPISVLADVPTSCIFDLAVGRDLGTAK
jgi:hypothetical protein